MSAATIHQFPKLLPQISLRSQYRFAGLLALVLRTVPNRISRQARADIGLCFGDRDTGEQRRLYRQTLRRTCYAMTEPGALWYWPVEGVRRQIREGEVSPAYRNGDRAGVCRSDSAAEFELGIQDFEYAPLAADEVRSARYMNNRIEALVRTRPEQYRWGYRRFSNRVHAAAEQG